MFTKIGITGLAVVMLWVGSGVAAETYRCEMKNVASNGPVPKTVHINLSPDTWEAAVIDDLTRQVSDEPVQVKVGSGGPQKWKLSAKLRGVTVRGHIASTVDFLIRLDTAKQRMTYHAVSFAANLGQKPISGRGKCELLKGNASQSIP